MCKPRDMTCSSRSSLSYQLQIKRRRLLLDNTHLRCFARLGSKRANIARRGLLVCSNMAYVVSSR